MVSAVLWHSSWCLGVLARVPAICWSLIEQVRHDLLTRSCWRLWVSGGVFLPFSEQWPKCGRWGPWPNMAPTHIFSVFALLETAEFYQRAFLSGAPRRCNLQKVAFWKWRHFLKGLLLKYKAGLFPAMCFYKWILTRLLRPRLWSCS